MVRAGSELCPQGLQTTGLAFSSAIKMRPSSAKTYTSSPQRAKPLKSDQEDRLGYEGVVERCDSLEFEVPKAINGGGNNARVMKQPIQPMNFVLGGDNSTSWKALPSRAFSGRPSSANVAGSRGKHRLDNAEPATPKQDGNKNGAGPFDEEWLPNPNWSGFRHERPRQGPSGLNGVQGIGQMGLAKGLPQEKHFEQDKAPHAEKFSPARNAQVEQLRRMLRRKEAEKCNVEMQNTVLVNQNADLKVQVAQLADDFHSGRPAGVAQRTKQRPWSANSAGSSSSISGRHALRIPNGAYRDQAWHQPLLKSAERGNGSRAVSARPDSRNGRGRAGSAPRQYPPGFLVQTGYNLRGKPVYGYASLDHRAVYTPCEEPGQAWEGAAENAVSAAGDDRDPPLPLPVPVEKDDLFRRPDAVRQFNMRSRPQSANAAVRAASAGHRDVSVVTGRPGSARVRSSYAERLQHQDADANAVLQRGGGGGAGGEEDMGAVLGMLRGKAAAKHVRVIDFCLPFDKLRRGAMSSSEFRRALEAAGCFRDVEESHLRAVIQLFADQPARPVQASVYRPAAVLGAQLETTRVGYAAFCEVLQPVGDRRVRLTPEQRLLMVEGQQRATNSLDSPLGANELSRAGEAKVGAIVGRILERSRTNRIPVRDLLGPLAGGGAKSSSVTPNVTRCPGCVSRAQFLRGIQGCNLGIRFSDEDLALLFCKFERNGEFNYFRFCRDLEIAQQPAAVP